MLEALADPHLASILALGEVERVDRNVPPPEPRKSLRDSLLELLDPRVWFHVRRQTD